MANPDKSTLDKVVALVTIQRELLAKVDDITLEIAELCGGRPGVAAKVATLERAWQDVWTVRYGSAYQWAYAKDRPAWKRLLKTLSVDELQARIVSYISNPDPFYLTRRHPFALFVASINSHAGLGTSIVEFSIPIECRHTPTCKTEQEHTRRRTADMRA